MHIVCSMQYMNAVHIVCTVHIACSMHPGRLLSLFLSACQPNLSQLEPTRPSLTQLEPTRPSSTQLNPARPTRPTQPSSTRSLIGIISPHCSTAPARCCKFGRKDENFKRVFEKISVPLVYRVYYGAPANRPGETSLLI